MVAVIAEKENLALFNRVLLPVCGIVIVLIVCGVDLSEAKTELAVLSDECAEMGKNIGMSIHVQHEAIFNAMHSV